MGLSVHLLLLSLITFALTNPERNPDCRKFVFAPICRGVAAKRSQMFKPSARNGFMVDASKLKELLKAYSSATSDWSNEDNTNAIQDLGLHPNKKNDQLDVPTFYDYEHVK